MAAAIAYRADQDTRNELYNGVIAGEDDYVSALANEIRRTWKAFNLRCYLHSQKLNRLQESTFGCDALILFKEAAKAKLCLFEAKYPRICSQSYYQWDSMQTSSQISHFSDQLRRQARWIHLAAIWELFVLECKPGVRHSHFDIWGSTCIWHNPVLKYDHFCRTSDKWNNDQLIDLLRRVKKPPFSTRQANLFDVLTSVLSCKAGFPIPIENGFLRITSSDRVSEVRVPSNLENMEQSIPNFCEEYGVKHFLCLELNDEA
ncbi:hypothetical protein IQ241_14060 [Romeria aff. gracilis LEGE 07310]|uniref:Uncharacterized protein n=1 Tax=Vasconcelosia minhoensis LEGE 07310 TaxID=915328 RepID=A0A8J7AQ99_9CYAN|nr:hypothetical protein [Romeria aff. gracilis LEGE 07310]